MFYIVLTVFAAAINGLPYNSLDGDIGEPLILSSYIAAGNINEAREAAKVDYLKPKLLSYSGFLTVNASCKSNMFFWFFPTQNDFHSDPVTVWLNGGPGSSSMIGLLTENGPYRLTTDGNLILNKYAWNRNSSVLYVDNPVGAGFSFTSSEDCYCKDQIQVATNFVAFLQQFFQLFPEIKKNKFMLAGESYAGKYIPAIAYAIVTKKTSLHLDGIAIGNGLIDPINQLHYSEHLYQLGLADQELKEKISSAENEIRRLIEVRNFTEAATKRWEMIDEIFGKSAGYKNYYNFLSAEPAPRGDYRKFLNKKAVREAIHVGNVPFAKSTLVRKNLYQDIMQSVRPWLEVLVDRCKVYLYYGQMDLRDSYVASRDFISDLKWSGSELYKKSKRKLWKIDNELAGYVKSYGNLTEIMIRNAGHFVPMDQPKWSLDMFNRFVFGRNF